MEIQKSQVTIPEKRMMERSEAENATLKANLDYVAMMTDVEIPVEDENKEEANV